MTPQNTNQAGLRYYDAAAPLPSPVSTETDVCIYGGTSGGVAAAVQAARQGQSVVLVEFGRHLGGLTSGGLGATDIGNKGAIGGIAREFYGRLGEHYGKVEAWTFEPGVAERLFESFIEQAGVPVFRERRLKSVQREGNRLTTLETEDGSVFRAKMFIDASYEGDLMAAAGVSYAVGRESNAEYGETLNGVHFGHPNHNFNIPIDPYVVPGDAESGLLWGISPEEPGTQGEGDECVQAYNFRVCLSDVPTNRRPFPRPDGYDRAHYALLLRYLQAGVWDVFNLNVRMPNGKSDHNNFGGFASDNIGRNYEWPDGDYATRERIFQDHVTYHQGLFWFLANDPEVPQAVRDEVNTWGLPLDEFPETGGWPHQLYVREARRMVSDCVMTEHHCRGNETVEDPIALAAYGMDSHNCRRVVVDGSARNEGNVETPCPHPYPISYRSIVPREAECANLVVPFCLSASHIAFGSIRMEPVFMVLGQTAATACGLALDRDIPLQRVAHEDLRARLEADKQVLKWAG